MLIKRIEIETKQKAKRQARLKENLEFKRDYGYYDNLIAEKARERQREKIGWFRSYQYNIDGTATAQDFWITKPETMRYSFNEKGEIVDVNKRLIVPRIKLKKFL